MQEKVFWLDHDLSFYFFSTGERDLQSMQDGSIRGWTNMNCPGNLPDLLKKMGRDDMVSLSPVKLKTGSHHLITQAK